MNNIWHDGSEEPRPNEECLVLRQSAWDAEWRRWVVASFDNERGWSDNVLSETERFWEEDAVAFKWAYVSDLYNISNL